jgi:riboflavin kinase
MAKRTKVVESKNLPELFIQGTVSSGTGKGKCFMELPWVQSQIEEKIGFTPYPGTLNLLLNKKSADSKTILENSEGIMILPEAGYYSGLLFKAQVKTFFCAVVLPVVPNYQKNLLEVIAPNYLRHSLNLVDGSEVTMKVKV